ncbi:hypothetical protein VspSTUT16_35740 [Vibrio sp. STUT-A16]|nr:hypothetical protein VspSTUT16_35740 [Vibrio sp. STUT-A16]
MSKIIKNGFPTQGQLNKLKRKLSAARKKMGIVIIKPILTLSRLEKIPFSSL